MSRLHDTTTHRVSDDFPHVTQHDNDSATNVFPLRLSYQDVS